MPLVHSQTPIVFTTSVSIADSVLTIPITNNSGTNFAYPLAKLVLITPLPSGTTFEAGSADWIPFASSWNNGQTDPINVYLYVASPIPVDYMLSFKLRVSNFSPLSIDSCEFTDTITVNLNPSGSNIHQHEKEISVMVFPNPAAHTLFVHAQGSLISSLTLMDVTGKHIRTDKAHSLSAAISVSDLKEGAYICTIELENRTKTIKRFMVQR